MRRGRFHEPVSVRFAIRGAAGVAMQGAAREVTPMGLAIPQRGRFHRGGRNAGGSRLSDPTAYYILGMRCCIVDFRPL